MSGDDDKKVSVTNVVEGVASIFAGSLPVTGIVRRGIDTATNVVTDLYHGQFGKATTDYAAGMVENNTAMVFGQAAGAGAREVFGAGVSKVAGEQYRPEDSHVVKDVKKIAREVKKLGPQR